MHYLRTKAWHDARMQTIRGQRGFIINPYAYAVTATDPYWTSVVLLLTGEGTDESTTVVDLSNSAHSVTVVSGCKYDDIAAPPGRATSIYLGNAGLTVPDSTDFDFGSGDFTVESWFQQQSTSVFPVLYNKLAAVNYSPFQFLLGSNNGDTFNRSSNDGSSYGAAVNTTSTVTTMTWYHHAWCRSGTTFYGWLGGSSLGTATMSGALTVTTDPLTIGSGGSGGNLMNGNISEFRITKGVARYTSAFTPPTIPFPTS